ncbi:enoyl-CoA hydratase-related protein [Pseudogracilibacillus sp. SO30301A]|uniref:enoyl-CoA hydratase-related protein n=1 Tax=Pseudogracilibacillus sp. SO30301A TaxID=3098291 RepID=UPI00300E057E
MEKVILTSENGISTITLNRPESYNALDVEILEKLLLFIKKVEHNDDRILMLTGAGKAFCSGGDISLMPQVTSTDQLENLMDTISEIATKLYMLPKIVVTAVNGSAVGLGLSFAMASDYIVANEKAKFGMLFAGIGLIPDGGGHFFLKERLGVHQAKQFIWNLEQIKAKQAQKIGLVDLVTESKAEEAAQALAQKILMSPFRAIIRSKLILHESKQAELAAYLKAEKMGQAEVSKTKDHKEGIAAFLEKRRPLFKGE